MYNRYHGTIWTRIWYDCIWYLKRVIEARNDILAGLGFGCLLVFLPIIAGFIIG